MLILRSQSTSGCGGLFCNSDGRWIKGYIKRILACDALHPEMWGMYVPQLGSCMEGTYFSPHCGE
ncbi:ribonuclease H [Trifolium medium]|uniref:Ribonuclease H n=1 Tax=Trifolium medium TaxID=97028 RepID=A0A392SJS4_9FABA|nr:ribonuclease H [Trifolium medium]